MTMMVEADGVCECIRLQQKGEYMSDRTDSAAE